MRDFCHPDELPLAHVYSQFVWHHDAKIIANPVALKAFSQAALVALEKGRATIELFADDGEGYGLTIERTNSTGMGYTRLPYIADYAKCDEADYATELRDRIAELEAALPAGHPLLSPSEASASALPPDDQPLPSTPTTNRPAEVGRGSS